MEFWLPNQIELNGTSKALIQDVEETARRVDEQRPLPDPVVRRINDDLLGERVYSSNAIEGNTLDLRETIVILKQGVLGAKKKREALEVRNLGQAVDAISDWIRTGIDCHTVDKLLQAHRLLFNEIDDEWAGRFREHRVMIRGATHQPPSQEGVRPLVERLMDELREPTNENAILRATWAHWAIARIHPFHDGNGRMARLWQDLVLHQSKLTCAVIRPEDRRQYLEALGEADEGEFNPIAQLVAQRASSTFDRYLIELRKEDELKDWVTDLVGEVDTRLEEKRKLDYMRWARRMTQLRYEFELCTARVTDSTTELGVQIRPFDIIDQSRWENIGSGVGAEQTWFFKMEFSRGRERRRYFFFFGRHFWGECDTDRDRAEPRVSLLISEDAGGGHASRLDQIPDCPLEAREVFVTDDEFVRKREDCVTGKTVYDRNVSALRIAQDFIRDVVLHRMT